MRLSKKFYLTGSGHILCTIKITTRVKYNLLRVNLYGFTIQASTRVMFMLKSLAIRVQYRYTAARFVDDET